MSTRLAARGHHVEVVTSRAISYVNWEDHYPPGREDIDGVQVWRLGVARPRSHNLFQPLEQRVFASPQPHAPAVGEAWMTEQGPVLPELPAHLYRRAGNFDVVVFFTYLYWPTWQGLQVTAGLCPTVLHATAHDELPFWLPIYDLSLRIVDRYAFSTPEERDLLARRIHRQPAGTVVGVGTELDVDGEPERFRRSYSLGDAPYLLYLGRLDPNKGIGELCDQFVAYRSRRPDSPLKLILAGDPVSTIPEHPDLLCLGQVDEQTKHDALAGCLALAQPSYFESFSMVLTEAWAQRRPALVQGRCDVLAGQARRSGGAIPYLDYAEWEAAVDLLVEHPELADELGRAGRRYVEANYDWETVMDRYEELLGEAAALAPRRLRVPEAAQKGAQS